MNCFFERFNKVSVCLCKSATEPLRRVRIIATAIALVLLILIPPAGGQELQLIDNLHVRPSHRSKKIGSAATFYSKPGARIKGRP